MAKAKDLLSRPRTKVNDNNMVNTRLPLLTVRAYSVCQNRSITGLGFAVFVHSIYQLLEAGFAKPLKLLGR